MNSRVVLEHIQRTQVAKPERDPKQWARDLKARHERGEKLAAHQITAYRQALGMEGRMPWQ